MTRLTFIAALFPLAALAGGPVDPVNKDRNNVAIKGYDPVAYFEQGRALKGQTGISHWWMDAHWRFASLENRDKFAADPAKYAPQFGGYCSWAVSQGYTAPVDPEAWKVVKGKLYLNYDKGIQIKWERDLDRRISDGEKNWPRLHK